MLIFTVRGCQPNAQCQSRRAIPCCFSAGPFPLYWQGPSIRVTGPTINNPKTHHAAATWGPHNKIHITENVKLGNKFHGDYRELN
jgi:hypothetical protein